MGGCLRAIIKLIGAVLLLVLLVVALTNAYCFVSGSTCIKSEEDAIKWSQTHKPDAIVVLGASVLPDGTPSVILQDRIDTAIDLYNAGVAPKLIMSGDDSTDSYNEAAAMKAYAVSKGVPSDDIFCDHAGVCTYDSMYRAQKIFSAETIVVVSQSYHLVRALTVAHVVGLNAIGVASDTHTYENQLYYDLREIPARVKDLAKAVLQRPSRSVAGEVGLDEDGDVTNRLYYPYANMSNTANVSNTSNNVSKSS